jgi:hypothetical protein
MDLVLVHGTWGRASEWHRPGGAFRVAAGMHGFTVHDFLWSGVLAGVPTTLEGDPDEAANGADDGRLLPWLDAGEKLRWYLTLAGLERPAVLSHSHGLQVVTFATWRGAQFATAVSISGPIRRDMLRARRHAAGCIGHWVQFADPQQDRTIHEGEWFDGDLDQPYALPEGETIETPGLGHSGFFTTPHYWAQAFSLLRGTPPAP